MLAALLAGSIFASAAHADAGDLLWSDVHDEDAQSQDVARAVVLAGSRVVVGGVTDTLGNTDALVRTYDGKTGALLWDEVFGTIGVADEINAAAARGRRAFVGGQTRAPGAISEAFFVRAYDARSGATLWQDLKDLTGGLERVAALSASGSALYALASVGAGNEAEVIAYQAKSGSRLWSDRTDFGGDSVEPRALAVSGKTLLVAAEVASAGGDVDFLLRAYEAKTGAFRFQHRLGAEPGDERALAAAAKGKLAFGGGALQGPGSGLDFSVMAYEARTGLPVWDEVLDGGSNGDDALYGLAASGKRLFAVGSLRGASEDFAVRAYDGRSGALLWSDRHDPNGGVDVAEAVTVAGSSVIVVGRSENANGNEDFLVRGYNAASGALRFEHRFDASGGFDAAHAAAVRGKRLFAAGESESGAADADITVRGLSAR